MKMFQLPQTIQNKITQRVDIDTPAKFTRRQFLTGLSVISMSSAEALHTLYFRLEKDPTLSIKGMMIGRIFGVEIKNDVYVQLPTQKEGFISFYTPPLLLGDFAKETYEAIVNELRNEGSLNILGISKEEFEHQYKIELEDNKLKLFFHLPFFVNFLKKIDKFNSQLLRDNKVFLKRIYSLIKEKYSDL